MNVTPRIAVTKAFLESYSRLPRKVQKKVREFTEKFRRDPTNPGINLERLNVARDPKVRSARIDQAHRVIVIHPPRGDVYLCVWVDKHDEAYDWVRDKEFGVNPESGVFQMFEMVEGLPADVAAAEPDVPAHDEPPPDRGLFDDVDDEDLLMAGVPRPLLAAVHAVRTEKDLDRLAKYLPEDAADVLYFVAAGATVLEALEEAERPKTAGADVDPDDFEAALARPESARAVKVVSDDDELQAMLDAPLEQWRVFLHPSQRKLVEMNANGPIRALGGAGTGKTVALMHRATHLATEIFTDRDDRILVTTFTRNLALDLEGHLKKLCGKAFERLEVTHLHSWAVNQMRKAGVEFRIVDKADRRDYFEAAVAVVGTDDWPMGFYKEEWEKIAQAQEIADRDAYFVARRVGRGTRLSRRQRSAVWRVFEAYRERLVEEGKVEWADVIRETRLFLEREGARLPYRAVLADEVQDFTAGQLKLLRAIVPPGPNDMFLVGDGHQRIYGHTTRLGHCGIEIRGRSRRLRLNYRTTAEIRNRAVALLEGCEIDDLDGEKDTLAGYFSLRRGVAPELRVFDTADAEKAFILERLRKWLEAVPAEEICIAARTNALIRDRYASMLEAVGIECVSIDKDAAPGAGRSGVRLATMHRLKGLEFPRVMLVSVHDGVVPYVPDASRWTDEAGVEDLELDERRLLYVAMTRARDELAISGYGDPSPLLGPVP